MTSQRLITTILTTIMLTAPFVASEAAVTWTRVLATPETSSGGDSRSVNFIDYDNDGWLDLMITNGPAPPGDVDFLYHNNGDGTFTQVVGDTIGNVSASSDGATWADADNDGDLDCFVATWYGLAIAFVAVTGALLGPRLLRW